MQFADDSGGEVGLVVDEVESRMSGLAETVPAGPVSETCFAKILLYAQNARFDGWCNWRMSLLERAVDLITTKQQRKQIEAYFQTIMSNDTAENSLFPTNYEAEEVYGLYHDLYIYFD